LGACGLWECRHGGDAFAFDHPHSTKTPPLHPPSSINNKVVSNLGHRLRCRQPVSCEVVEQRYSVQLEHSKSR
ncbi:hypothetical protein THAOC_33588, partial [Thalassiosira oceanica]